jgi:transposase
MFGALSFQTNVSGVTPQKIYTLYKGRCQIEEYFDCFKNVLQADRMYMQNDQACEAWIFVNHLAMLLLSKLYVLLREKDLLKRYSPQDLLMHLNMVQKIKIEGEWLTSEIPQKTRKLFSDLDVSIT